MILEEKDAIIAEMLGAIKDLLPYLESAVIEDNAHEGGQGIMLRRIQKTAQKVERYLTEHTQPQVCDQHLDRKAIHSGQCVFQSDNCNCCRECLYQCVRQDKEHAQERPTE
jgi:intracellular sulfur oxidation DsrE/DsrF family protein